MKRLIILCVIFLTAHSIINAQRTLILSVDDSCWTRQDLPGAYMSVEAPAKLTKNFDYKKDNNIKAAAPYGKLLLAINIVALYEEYDDTVNMNIMKYQEESLKTLRKGDSSKFSLISAEPVAMGDLSGRILKGKLGFFIEEFPEIDFTAVIYSSGNKFWSVLTLYLENETNRLIADRIIGSVEIDLNQEQIPDTSNTMQFAEENGDAEEEEEPEYEWETKTLDGTGITLELPFDPVKTISVRPALGVDTLTTYSYKDNIDFMEFNAIYGLLTMDKYVDVQTKALQIISAVKQNLVSMGKVSDFSYKMETLQISGKNYIKMTGGFSLNEYKIKFIYNVYKDGFKIWNIHCFFSEDSESWPKTAERIINSAAIDFGGQIEEAEKPAFTAAWEEKKLDDTGITLDVPFALSKTIGSIPAQGIDSIISYNYSETKIEFEATYGKYSVEPFIDAPRKALLIVTDLRQKLSAARSIQDFIYKIDTVQADGADRAIATGSYILDGANIRFIYIIQAAPLQMWDVHCIYSDNKENREIAERIINSVKIENQ